MSRGKIFALAGAVGLVLADSSIVVLALPEIFRQFDTSIAGVSWVLIVFNLVLALLAVPAARLARHYGPGRSAAVGLAVFAGGSLVCGLATGLGPLLTGRAVQAAGGAVAVVGALELLVASLGQATFIKQYLPIFFISTRDLFIGAGLTVVLGLVAGILPAIQAMRLRLADALRREG